MYFSVSAATLNISHALCTLLLLLVLCRKGLLPRGGATLLHLYVTPCLGLLKRVESVHQRILGAMKFPSRYEFSPNLFNNRSSRSIH